MSSKRRIRNKQCIDKKRHKSIEDAYAARSGHVGAFGKQLHASYCQFCHGWHIGHPKQKPLNRQNFKLI
jgi:cytochrome c5